VSRTNNRKLRERVRKLEHDALVYEALLACVECAYCKEVLLRERDELLAHAKTCPGHPCRELERQIADLKTTLSLSWEHEVDL
jgi:hypothetical protein